ncbi:MAG: class I SAM-dependent methyltransferase [Chloroflexi bacterium]|nr:class I SAM-dependent methyltransferase [Chloroflexota bacterium]
MKAKGQPFLDADLAAARRYDRWYETPRGQETAPAEEALLDDLLARFDGTASLLEIGCGRGHFTRWFAGRRLRVVGLDPSPAMLAVAAEPDGGISHARGSAESLPFADGAFDLVAFVTSLEFLPNPAVALREARRVGRLGVILGVLNAASPLGLRRKLEAPFRPFPYGTAHFYTTRGFAGLLRRELGADARVVVVRTALWPRWAFIGAAVDFAPTDGRRGQPRGTD